MNKYLSVLLLVCLIVVSTIGCSKNKTPQIEDNSIETQDNSTAIGNAGSESSNTQENPTANEEVDIDLTILSSTMVYAEVNNMMTNPNEYLGKKIRANGLYCASYYDETGQYYHYLIIEDATACCQQGLEFIWSGNHSYPADYPKNYTRIEFIGVFGKYDELGLTYYYLAVDNIFVV